MVGLQATSKGCQDGCDTPRNMVVRVTLTGDLSGEYVVDEVLDDGRLVIRPDTSAQAINRRLGLEPITAAQFDAHFGHLPTDDEQDGGVEAGYPAVFPTGPGRVATAAEFEQHFGDLATDDEP